MFLFWAFRTHRTGSTVTSKKRFACWTSNHTEVSSGIFFKSTDSTWITWMYSMRILWMHLNEKVTKVRHQFFSNDLREKWFCLSVFMAKELYEWERKCDATHLWVSTRQWFVMTYLFWHSSENRWIRLMRKICFFRIETMKVIIIVRVHHVQHD